MYHFHQSSLSVLLLVLLLIKKNVSSPDSLEGLYAIRIDWIIWKIAEPHTTKMNNAKSHGPTGYFSSFSFDDLGTLPR